MQYYWLNAIPFVAVGLFEGWLLFTRGFRLIAWAFLPVLHLIVPYLVGRGALRTSSIANAFGFASIVTIIIATLLLNGVRQKPWLWLFIQLGTLVASQLLYALFFTTFGFPALDRLAGQINGLLHLTAPLALSGNAILTSASSGIWLLGAILAAWALAYWMPPLRKPAVQSTGKSQVQPVPPA
jgi:hypothetical protein